MRTSKLFWRVNETIGASEVRVIGSDGKQLGIMPTKRALEKSKKEGLDLVEIAPTATPPVTKIVNFGKFRYQEEKKLRKQSAGVKGGDIKEVRFSPFIAENDYNIRLVKVREFLNEKNKVRLVVVFKRPQMGSKQFGYNLLKRIVDELEGGAAIDMEPKFLGKHLIMVISPTAKKIIHAETKE